MQGFAAAGSHRRTQCFPSKRHAAEVRQQNETKMKKFEKFVTVLMWKGDRTDFCSFFLGYKQMKIVVAFLGVFIEEKIKCKTMIKCRRVGGKTMKCKEFVNNVEDWDEKQKERLDIP